MPNHPGATLSGELPVMEHLGTEAPVHSPSGLFQIMTVLFFLAGQAFKEPLYGVAGPLDSVFCYGFCISGLET